MLHEVREEIKVEITGGVDLLISVCDLYRFDFWMVSCPGTSEHFTPRWWNSLFHTRTRFTSVVPAPLRNPSTQQNLVHFGGHVL